LLGWHRAAARPDRISQAMNGFTHLTVRLVTLWRLDGRDGAR